MTKVRDMTMMQKEAAEAADVVQSQLDHNGPIVERIGSRLREIEPRLIVTCARETLAEADHFAEDAGFNPVAFVAMPEKGLFGGEPNFGETSVARAYLGDGRVQFDAEPVRVGRAADAPTPAAPAASPPASPRPATASTGKAGTSQKSPLTA